MLNNRLKEDFLSSIQHVVSPSHLFVDEPMSRHTTFQIGGPADYLVCPATPEEVADALCTANRFDLPLTILGNGSNVLVLDKGIRGVVIKIGTQMGYVRHAGNTIFAGAGTPLSKAAMYAADLNLTGMEFAVGIPGSLGGAVFMNAGAYDGEMSFVVNAVSAVSPVGSIRRFTREEIDFGYRHSIFQQNSYIICEVEFTLAPGDPAAIRAKMADYTNRRLTKQPIDMPSAGSTFKRPPGYFAGTLIEQTGLKGLTVGGAQVSEKHAGFIVNVGGATAQDVLNLIKEVQRRVFEHFGVKLHPEVRVMGEE